MTEKTDLQPKIKAVACDLDGTLLNKDGEIHPSDLKAFKTLGKMGVCRIIATGRSLFSFRQVIPDDFPIDYLILCAGGGTVDFESKEVIDSSVIPAEDVRRIALKLRNFQIDYQVRDIIPKDHFYKYERFFDQNPDFDRLNNHYKDFTEPVQAIEELGAASRIISIAPGQDYIEFFESFSSDYGIIRATSPTDHRSVWMEIYPHGVNKGRALDKLLQTHDIQLGETLGLGNDYNDIHLLDLTGRSFVVDNAPPALKAKYETTVNHNRAPLSAVLSECGIKI
jgi:Cof subfamily protein (haloacid dehalogenase superfamily)